MMPAYDLRLARADELAHLQAIERAAAARFAAVGYPALAEADPLPLATLRQAQQESRLWVAVLRATDVPVGLALAEVLDGHAHLAEMDVLPAHGRQGLGRALVAQVCRWATEEGLAPVTLTTFRNVPWNAPFYQKLGFVEVPASAWSPALRARIAAEADAGLPAADRVVLATSITG